MPSTPILALGFLAACAALQIPLFALPLLYLRWRSALNNFEAFVALSLMCVSSLPPNLHVPFPYLTISLPPYVNKKQALTHPATVCSSTSSCTLSSSRS
jgi:hypothetical protein